MNDLQIFNNKELGLRVRTIQNDDGSISINAEDTAIGFGWTQAQMKRGKQYISVRWERMNGFSSECGFPHEWGKEDYIPESLFYRLGMKANNAVADKFQNWLAMEVIPAIRKTGSYSAAPKGKDLLALAVLEAQKVIERQDKEIERMRPKEIFADAVAVSNDAILIGELAKLIKQNGREIGQNRLFAWMRKNGYLISRNGNDHNMPTQRSMDLKLFRIKERSITNPDGSVRTTRTTLVTGKGQQYFVNKFLNGDGAQMKIPLETDI